MLRKPSPSLNPLAYLSLPLTCSLSNGRATTSHAAYCARACGIPEAVIERANYIHSLADKHELDTIQLEALGALELDARDCAPADGPSRAPSRTKAQALEERMVRFLDWDIQKDIVTRSEGLTQILGYSLAEAEPTRQWWLDLIHPDDLRAVD